MKYCKKCIMPDTRPGIKFNEKGVCQGCITEELKDKTDWDARLKELEKYCDKYRGMYGDWYDCIIAVSGGKDSHYQVHVMKELMNMNPLLITVEDNYPMTKAGAHNIKNISKEFGCDIISIKPNIKIQNIMTRYCFEKYGKPTYYIDRLIYSFPLHMAIKMNLSLVVYGEDINYQYGGEQDQEKPSALEQIYNGVASGIELDEFLALDGIEKKDLGFFIYPTIEEMKAAKLDPIYLSYFRHWSSYHNYLFAKSRGFKDLSTEWKRTHHVEDWGQVDTRAYILHAWMKWPKFGHASATDLASSMIRSGVITRDEAIEMVKKHEPYLDQKVIDDFCEFHGYTRTEFWKIIDSHYNPEIFEKDKYGVWQLINPLWKQK